MADAIDRIGHAGRIRAKLLLVFYRKVEWHDRER